MKQVLFGRTTQNIGSDGANDGYCWPQTSTLTGWRSNEFSHSIPWPLASSWRNLKVKLTTAPGAGASRTYAVRIGGVDTGCSVTISDTATEGTSLVQVTNIAGQDVTLHRTFTGSPAGTDTLWSVEVENATTDESCYGSAGNGNQSNLCYAGIFWNSRDSWNLVETNQRDLIACPGTLLEYTVALDAGPGAGTKTYVVIVNQVVQDGTGGTVDTTLTMTGATVKATKTFSLPLVAGDLVNIRHTGTGSPTASQAVCAIRYRATTPGQSQMNGGLNESPSTTLAVYHTPSGSGGFQAWSATESEQEFIGPVTPMFLSNMRVFSPVVITPWDYTFSVRRNGASTPAGAPSVQLVNPATAGSDLVRAISIGTNDLWAIQSVPAGSPSVLNPYWAFIVGLSECAGGGGFAVVGDPAPGEEFVGPVFDVRAWLIVKFDDEDREFAIDAYNHLPTFYGGRKVPNVIKFGAIARGLSTLRTPYKMGECQIEIDDASRLLSTLESVGASEHWQNRETELWIASQATIDAAGTARCLMRGRWRGYKSSGLGISISIADMLGSEFSDFTLERQIPDRIISTDDFPSAGNGDPSVLGLPVPIAYGFYTDLLATSGSAVAGVATVELPSPEPAPTNVVAGTTAGDPKGQYGSPIWYAVAFKINGIYESARAIVTVTNASGTIPRLTWDTPPSTVTEIRIYRGADSAFTKDIGSNQPAAAISTLFFWGGFSGFSLPVTATSFDDEWLSPAPSKQSPSSPWVVANAMEVEYHVHALLATGYTPAGKSNLLRIEPVTKGGPSHLTETTWTAPSGALGYKVLRYRRWVRGSRSVAAYDKEWNVGAGIVSNLDHITEVSLFNSAVTNFASQTGALKTIHVEDIIIGGLLADCYVIAGHAISHVEQLYVDDVDPGDFRQIPDSDWGTVWYGPGKPGWPLATNYVDINGNRYGLVFTTQDMRHRSPIPQVRVNACCLEDTAEGVGSVITSAPRQVFHLLQNWILPEAESTYRSGAWATARLFKGGVPIVNTASMVELERIEVDRVGGQGYEGHLYIGEFLAVRQVLAKVFESFGIRFGQNAHGQIIGKHFDSFFDATTARALTDVRDIVESTKLARVRDEMENRVVFDYGYRPADRTYDNVGAQVDDTLAITDNLEKVALGPRRAMQFVRNAGTAFDVAGRALLFGKYPPRYATITCGLPAISVNLGDIVAVTDYEGVGADGWVGRPLWVLEHSTQLGSLTAAPTVRLMCMDVKRLLDSVRKMGPGSLTDWASESAANKAAYIFLTDASGNQSDGSKGFRMP